MKELKIGENIKVKRRERDFTQEELAYDWCDEGCRQQMGKRRKLLNRMIFNSVLFPLDSSLSRKKRY